MLRPGRSRNRALHTGKYLLRARHPISSLCHTEWVRPHLASLIEDFRRHGSQIAVVAHRGNRRFPTSWEVLAELSARFASELERRGIGSGDRVLIWGANSAEWVAAFFGCILRGVIAVPLDAAGSVDFARRVAAEVQPMLMVGDPELIGRVEGDEPGSHLEFSAFANTLPAPDYVPVADLSRDTVLQIIFTSGTTAEPKGIVHTHGNVLASLDPLEDEIGKYLRYERIFHPLRFLHTLPLSHVFGQFMGLWVPPVIAAEVHYETRLEASRLIRTIRDERISVLAAVPRVLDLLRVQLTSETPELPKMLAESAGQSIWKRWWRFRKLHRRFGLKFWAFVCGGASLSSDLENFWTTAGFALVQGYGMTETTALVTLNHPFKSTKGSIGKPLKGREVEIAPGGEILVRGASIADRVWQNGHMVPRGEEWLATGDLVTRDERGELVFAGRKSDVIVTSAGLNIHPEDLEAVLRRQAEIREALVVPYISASGPVPVAVVIPERSGSSVETAVLAANRELAGFQQILYWLAWPQPDLPRTSTGKALRRQVATWVAQTLAQTLDGKLGSAVAPATPGFADPLLELLHQLQPATRNQPITDSDRLQEDLHLDSLAMVQLESAIETKFGVELGDTSWQQVRTVGQLRALLDPRLGSHLDSTHAEAADGESSAARLAQGMTESTAQPIETAVAGPALRRGASDPKKVRRDVGQVFPRWPWSPPLRALRLAFLELLMRPLAWFLLAPKIAPRVPLHRPSLLIANHVTAFDVPIVLYALTRKDRDNVAVAMSGEILSGWRVAKAQKHRLLNLLTPVAYWLVTALFNVFPLPRARGLRQSFAHAGEAMDRGYHVLVFPEGGRSADGRLRTFQSGIGLLAQESQAPVQPIYLEGLGPLKLRQKSWFRPGTVRVRLGKPLFMHPGEEPADFAQRLHGAIEELAARAKNRSADEAVS
jgi:long-chain acyl-CoA synthetase